MGMRTGSAKKILKLLFVVGLLGSIKTTRSAHMKGSEEGLKWQNTISSGSGQLTFKRGGGKAKQ